MLCYCGWNYKKAGTEDCSRTLNMEHYLWGRWSLLLTSQALGISRNLKVNQLNSANSEQKPFIVT